jgi:hypothetical protein
MAEKKYEIDDQGNLVSSGEEPAGGPIDQADGRPATAADRRRLLSALLASDVIGVAVLVGAGLLLSESRTILFALAAAYAVVSVPIYIWISRSSRRKVEADSGPCASS